MNPSFSLRLGTKQSDWERTYLARKAGAQERRTNHRAQQCAVGVVRMTAVLNILSSPYKRCTRAEGEQKIALEVNTEYLNSARDRKSLTARAMCCPQVVAGLEGIECDCDEIARLKKKEPPVRGVSALLPFFSMCSSCPSFQVRSSSGFCCLASFWLPSNDVEDHLSSLRGSLNKVASAWKYGDLCSR